MGAPEVLNKSYGSQCDMWSLGVTVFGYMPFTGTEERQIQRIKAGSYVKKASWENVSKDAQDFVEKLLIVQPEKRMTAKKALEHQWIHARDERFQSDHCDDIQPDMVD